MKKILLILAFLFSIAITAQTTTTTVGTLKHNNTPPITTGNLYTIVWNETTKKFERQLISGGDTPTLQQVTTQGASTEVMTYFNNGASIFKQGLNNNGSINVNGDSLNMGSADNTTGTLGSSFDITAERTQLRSYNTDLTKNSYITSEPAIIQITSGNEYRTSFIDVLPDEVRVTGTDSFCKGLVGASDFSANYTPLSYVQKSYVDGLVSGGGAGATNISYVPSTRNIVSSTGTGAVLPIADGTNYGLSFNDFTTAEKSKLASTPTTFFNGAYSSLTGIPSTFTPSAHSHVISDVTSLQTTIDAKVTNDLTASTTVAPSKTAINTALALKYDASNPAGYQTSTQVTSGARSAISLTTTGTSGASTYNSTTGVLNVPNYASGITTETDPLSLKITNNLSDLNNATTARTNLGLGTLSTQSGTFTAIPQANITNLTTDLSNKQATLVSGTNLKTINASSLLGSTDISLQTPLIFSTGLTNTTGTVTVNASQNISTLSNLTTNGYVKTSASAGTLGVSTTIPTTDLSGTLAATQFPTLTGDLTTTAGSLATTLATVNSNVGSFNRSNVTVNAKGLVTSVSNGNTKNLVEWTNTTALAGLWTGTAGVGAGTYTAALPTDTNLYTSIKRSIYSNVVTTTNQVLGVRCNEALFFRGSSVSGAGGFTYFARGGFNTWTNGGRFFAGMATATGVLGSNPSLLANTVGFATDDTDNGLISFMTRSGTTLTKVSTGFTWASNNGYDFEIFCAPNGSEYTWKITSLQTGATVTGTANTNLPVNNTKQLAFFGASNAALTPVNSIQLGVNKITIETNY